MNKSEMNRLIKVEDKIYQIAEEEGLEFCPIEFDIVPNKKMMELMAYLLPGNISNWKYGRDYEKIRTMYEKSNYTLPLEMVVNTNPSRAYLMKENTFAIQALVMTHVVGHVAYFTMNRHFQPTDKQIVTVLLEASKRFNKYERMYGIDIVEKTIDAAHAIMFHSSPFDTELESEKRERIFTQLKRKYTSTHVSEFEDIIPSTTKYNIEEDVELFNRKLWMSLKKKTPVQPTEDFLRYIIDNSTKLDDWQKDICEIIRQLGIYLHPQIRSKYSNEGFATYTHERIMWRLFQDGYLNKSDHAQYNYSNSLVKAENPLSLNPYLVGSKIWENIEDRWNKGRHGQEYNNLTSINEIKEWDTKEMKGREKVFKVLRTCNDWFFMKEFLTPDLVNDLNLYIYVVKETHVSEDLIITRHKAKEIAELIISSFIHSGVPKVKIINGNYNETGVMKLEHMFSGAPLEPKYCEETMKHIFYLWGNDVMIKTNDGKNDIFYAVSTKEMKVKKWKN